MFGFSKKSMSQEMALLVLLWQEACLEHDVENDVLLPGAKSATVEEEKVLDAVYEREQMKESWDDFNKAYSCFSSASERVEACLVVLAKSEYDFKVKVVKYLVAMASASFENNSLQPISEEEAKFIQRVKTALEVNDADA